MIYTNNVNNDKYFSLVTSRKSVATTVSTWSNSILANNLKDMQSYSEFTFAF